MMKDEKFEKLQEELNNMFGTKSQRGLLGTFVKRVGRVLGF